MYALRIALIGLLVMGCKNEPTRPTQTPPPLQSGVAAYITVDNLDAVPGQTVRVRVEVQVGSQSSWKLGSYTGRLRFDATRLAFHAENRIADGLRVANNNNAGAGDIRFAGAAAEGFQTLVLYDGTFEVRQANFLVGLQLQMEELSAARTLTNLVPQLRVNRQVFLSTVAPR